MNERKICFIMCTNDVLYRDEAILYIQQLEVPPGYETQILTIEQADSMAAGYNEGMRASDAKYKIYLHQDVFLCNRHFLYDILEIFKSDGNIGMIGVVGTPKLSATGIMWNGERYGMLYGIESIAEQEVKRIWHIGGQECGNDEMENDGGNDIKIMDAQAIDGLMMITQYDIAWREDILKGWDFYDASQSLEMLKKGYRVVIGQGAGVWCAHDCGFLDLDNYEHERAVFLKEYGTMIQTMNAE